MIYRGFKQLSYRVQISIVMVLFAVIPLLLFGILYIRRESEKWSKDALTNYTQTVSFYSEMFSREVHEIELKSIHVSNMISIRNAISKLPSEDLVNALKIVDTLSETVEAITVDNSDLVVRWYSYNGHRNYGKYIYALESFKQEFLEDELLLENILSLELGKQLMAVREINRAGSAEKHFCVYMKMNSIKGGDCILEMSMPFHRMIELQSDDFPEGCILGVCLQLNQKQQIFVISEAIGEAETILDTYYSSGMCPGYYPYLSQIEGLSGSQIICLFPKNYVIERIITKAISTVIVIVIFLLTIIVCSYVASTMLTNRVTRFLEQMKNDLDTILLQPTEAFSGDRDFQSIEKRIRRLILTMQEYYTKLEQYEAEKNRLELELLQMRFNPHFLYNTLTSIRYQIKDKKIHKSIDSLIHYYRIILSKGHLRIQIKEEIEMIREYMELQIFAYNLVNVRYEIAVEEAVKPCMIIKHLLQPIVENALEHGLRTNGDQGIIKIRARLEGKDIIFEIEDNGAGMTEEQVAMVLTEPAYGSVGGGYGVYNVQQRIEAYYGAGYGISFHSTPGVGTCATIRIPWDKCC